MPLTPTNWEQVKEIVADALELSADRREQFLVDSCNGDERMLTEVRALVGSYEQTEGVIDRRTDVWLGVGGPDLLALGGQRIGRYMLERLIAEGAMAAVYAARQANPQRAVAIKLVRASLPMVDSSERFRRESAALGRLQHPNIARIYEAGVHKVTGGPGNGNGAAMPYIAMELVDGPPLTQFARERKLGRAQRIGLMIKVASAVHAAHQQAVIHRDLKPANVLVDSTGEPKVLDFGIARIIGVDDEHNTWQTTAGVLLGTPGYMSPEQAAGRPGDVDVRSDVWALGVLLHELLTDRLPIEVKNTSIAEALKRIETTEPPPLSTFDRSLRGDLETIVGTALSREKERRYPSAQALADDLRRVLDYEPITARPPGRWYRVTKFIRRHRVGLAFTTAFILLLIGAVIVSSIALVRAREEKQRTERVNNFLLEMMSTTDPNIGKRDITVIEALEQSDKLIARNFATDPLVEADVRSTIGWTFYNLSKYDPAVAQLQQAVALSTKYRGARDVQTLDIVTRLVTAMRWQYKDPQQTLDAAEPAYRTAVEVLGEYHATTAALLDVYAGSMDDLGRYPQAEALYRKASEVNAKVLGPNENQTLSTLNNLAVVLINQARWKDAEVVLRDVIARRSSGGKGGRVSALTNRQNLAHVLSNQGRVGEAIAELESTIADSKELLGENHSRTLSAMTTYGDALLKQGRLEEGLAVHQDVLKRRLPLGETHEQVLVTRHNVVNALIGLQRFTEAEQVSRKLLEDVKGNLEESSLLQIAARADLAASLSGLKRYDEAEPLWLDTIDRWTRKVGADHPSALNPSVNYAGMLYDAGRIDEAMKRIELIGVALERRPSGVLEPAYRKTRARVLERLGRPAEAAEQFELAYKACVTVGNAKAAADNAGNLVRLYEQLGRPDDAARWREMQKP